MQYPAVPLIDFRVRPPVGSFKSNFFRAGREQLDRPGVPGIIRLCYRKPVPSRDAVSFELFLEEMDEAGIVHAVLFGRVGVDNTEISALIASHGERFSGFGSLQQDDPRAALAELATFRDMGLAGVSLDSKVGDRFARCDDPVLFPIYAYCEEHGLPVSINGSYLLAENLDMIHPLHIEAVAQKFPRLKILVSHACWPWTIHACALASRFPNVFLLPDLYGSMPGQKDFFDLVRAGVTGQVLFSSSYPAMALGEAADTFRAANGLPGDDAYRAAFAAAAALLGKDPDTLAKAHHTESGSM